MDQRQPPAFRNQPAARGLRRVPPAIFPPVLGLFGLGLAGRRAAEVGGLPDGVAEAVLGAVSLVYLVCLAAYLGKLALRPAVIGADLTILPGRSGVTAANLAMMLFATTITPYNASLALIVILVALLIQLGMIGSLLFDYRQEHAGARPVTPVWHMVLVGPILAAPGLIGLGQVELARLILWLAMPLALLIWGVSLRQLLTRIPPAPLRPLLAIHLAPASLFATVGGLLDLPWIGGVFTCIAALICLILLASLRWITAAGFSPLWGAFTFPLAAFTSALLVNGWLIAGLLMLALASAVILPIAVMILRAWVRGTLAAQTNAATA